MHRTLSSTGILAVNAMIDLALQSRTAPVRLSIIGERQGISKSYIDQLFGKLRRHALVRATRGPGGGYSLGRDAERISVADIVVAVDKSSIAAVRGRKPRGLRDSLVQSLTHELWNDLNSQLTAWLDDISLQALIDERLARDSAVEAAAVVRAIASRPAVKSIEVSAPNPVFVRAAARSPRAQFARQAFELP